METSLRDAKCYDGDWPSRGTMSEGIFVRREFAGSMSLKDGQESGVGEEAAPHRGVPRTHLVGMEPCVLELQTSGT